MDLKAIHLEQEDIFFKLHHERDKKLMKKTDREFKRRAGPLTYVQGFPSAESLKQMHGESGDYVGLFLPLQFPIYTLWISHAFSTPFQSEGELIDFALIAPRGLRWVMEAASHSGFGFIELIRRCRFALRSPDIPIEPRISVIMELTDDEIPFFYVSPPEIKRKEISTRLFFHLYLLRIRRSPRERANVLCWVGPSMPPEIPSIRLPAMAVHFNGGILPSRCSFSSFWRKIGWAYAFPVFSTDSKICGVTQRADGIAVGIANGIANGIADGIAGLARKGSSCRHCLARAEIEFISRE